MSTLFLSVALVLLGCIVLSAVAVTAVLLIHLWRWALRTDPHEPPAAETPYPVEQQYAAVGDTFGFNATSKPVVVYTLGPPPGWKRLPSMDEALDDLVSRYRRGEDIESGAPKEQA